MARQLARRRGATLPAGFVSHWLAHGHSKLSFFADYDGRFDSSMTHDLLKAEWERQQDELRTHPRYAHLWRNRRPWAWWEFDAPAAYRQRRAALVEACEWDDEAERALLAELEDQPERPVAVP
jgi:hypothetical protein